MQGTRNGSFDWENFCLGFVGCLFYLAHRAYITNKRAIFLQTSLLCVLASQIYNFPTQEKGK
jgi:hypothetical protein